MRELLLSLGVLQCQGIQLQFIFCEVLLWKGGYLVSSFEGAVCKYLIVINLTAIKLIAVAKVG